MTWSPPLYKLTLTHPLGSMWKSMLSSSKFVTQTTLYWEFLSSLLYLPESFRHPKSYISNLKGGVFTSPQRSHQFSSVTQSCLTLCDPMNHRTPGLPVHHQLPEFTQTYIHWVSDAIQPSHPLSSPSPPAPNPSQHQRLFQWVNSSHEVARVLEIKL